MKTHIIRLISTLLILNLGFAFSFAQETPSNDPNKLMRVVKHDGTEFVGRILENDAREILIETEEYGQLYIPKHEIRKTEEVSADEFFEGKYVGQERFATRYFLTTNGLPIEKGDHYAMFNWYGPEVHFAVGDNFSLGVMTTWIAMPLVGSAKYSVPIGDNASLGIGALAGSTLWLEGGYGALGYGSITFGHRRSNFTVSGGYAAVGSNWGGGGSAPLMSLAGMAKIDQRITFVFDSFIYLGTTGEDNGDSFALFMPGFRFNSRGGGAFQMGVGALMVQGELIPAPMPVFSWFKAIGD